MSDTAIDLDFADGRYRFFLPWPQLIELEQKTGKSVFVVHQQLGDGLGFDAEENAVFVGGVTANALDAREVIRLGLIGGGNGWVDGSEVQIGPNGARGLCDNYAYPARPLAESVAVAWTILEAAIKGINLKKKAEVVDDLSASEKG